MTAVGVGFNETYIASLKAAGIEVLSYQGERLQMSPRSDQDFTAFWQVTAQAGVEIRYLGLDHATLEDAVVAVMEGGQRDQ